MMLYLRENGFAVYLFEGPGQGGALRKEGLTFIFEITPEHAHTMIDTRQALGFTMFGKPGFILA